jgi:hypothetical protein
MWRGKEQIPNSHLWKTLLWLFQSGSTQDGGFYVIEVVECSIRLLSCQQKK